MLKAILLDISGVLTEDGEALPGAIDAVAQLQESELALRFLTNTSRKTSAKVCEDLKALGFHVAPAQVFTAPGAIRRYLAHHRLCPYLLVHERLEPEFDDLPRGEPDAVVLGDAGQRLDYALLDEAFRLLLDGAPLLTVGTNRYFRQAGEFHLDAGPFVRALEYAAGIEARVLGKPSEDFFRDVLDEAGVAPGEAMMVGDDVECDVVAAMNIGLQACLVRSGKYRQGDEAQAPEAHCEASLADLVPTLMASY